MPFMKGKYDSTEIICNLSVGAFLFYIIISSHNLSDPVACPKSVAINRYSNMKLYPYVHRHQRPLLGIQSVPQVQGLYSC